MKKLEEGDREGSWCHRDCEWRCENEVGEKRRW